MRHVLFVDEKDIKLGMVLRQRILRAEDKLIGVELKVAEQMLAGVEDVVEVLYLVRRVTVIHCVQPTVTGVRQTW